ncbi:hypothetical protein [Croceicoccus naphthovorans]|uniref:Uncharacterized protein n=1 Tax=Croceicoccus naphthovorans TaxID=1348774 RepID=A0A0G3XF92_9SPHN|nr:hypothetical protein [Croceicoccus naphthovorans]AKM09316.1 hypothetical protein AB433_03905 [Croceicoccus naphthovorans]MBB3990224.1 hypothetical protein [Croceicoccus naphthovorans]
MAYQAGQIKRRRRTRAQVDQLDSQIMDVLRADHPQSVRHVFYRMTNPRLPEPVEKTDNGYNQVQHRVAELRRSGSLPYGWISDSTCRGYHVATYDDEAQFLRAVSRQYRADVWRDADVYCEVWCESRSIAGVIQDDCERLAVSLYPAGGFTSMTLAYQSAEYIRAYSAGRPAVIFYIGDYDPAGVLIDQDIHQKLIEHLEEDVRIDFRRIAITPEQIHDYDLPTKPRKAGDKRARYIEHTVEAEAMPAHALRKLLADHIESLLPVDAVKTALIEEQSARDYFDVLAGLREREG